MKKLFPGKKIVIYGGGIAGAILARKLRTAADIVLVDPNDYFEVPMAAPRNLVKPDFAENAIIPFSEALPEATHIAGKLATLDGEEGLVSLNNGRQINLKGDVTVLATGSHFGNNLMRATGASATERKDFYNRFSQRVVDARTILIVGGGPLGVEVAGEITERHPKKSVTLLESGARLLGSTTSAGSKVATAELTKRGVNIITGEKLVRADSGQEDVFATAGAAITSSGRTLHYDLLIWCTGGKPNTGYMQAHHADLLNDKGQIRVAPSLRVEGRETLFALGDITDLDENKMAWHIASQVKNAAINIRRVLAGKTAERQLKSHTPQTGNPMMAVTLGSRHGVICLPVVGAVKNPILVQAAKSGHMLVPKFRKELGV